MGAGPTPGHHWGLEHPTPGCHGDVQGCGGGPPPLELLESDTNLVMTYVIRRLTGGETLKARRFENGEMIEIFNDSIDANQTTTNCREI